MQKCLTEKKKCSLQNFICKSQNLKCSATFYPNASRTFYFASRIFRTHFPVKNFSAIPINRIRSFSSRMLSKGKPRMKVR